MEPSSLASGGLLPSASSWYMNPFFLASFGAFAAIGFVTLVAGYFLIYRLKPTPKVDNEERCSTCGMTGDMIAKLIPCSKHEGMVIRVDALETLFGRVQKLEGLESRVSGTDRWIANHDLDYREVRQRVDAIERNKK